MNPFAPAPSIPRWRGLPGLLLTLAAAMALAGCAAPAAPAAVASPAGPWSGRLAVQAEDASVPSYAALFELAGSAAQGRLTLTSPLGTVLGMVEWQPGSAHLVAGDTREDAGSLEALLVRLTGASLPIAALFDWLQGHATAVPGWTLERLDVGAGRIVAHREQPLPRISLRVVVSP